MDNPVTFSDITLLNTLATCANMTTDEVFKDFKIMANKKILKNHKYEIYYSESEKSWRTYLPDETKPNKRRPVKRKSKENLEKEIIRFYIEKQKAENRQNVTLEELYAEWLLYKRDYTSVKAKTIQEYVSEWNRFFKDTELVKMKIGEIKPITLIRFFREATKDRQFTHKRVSNARSVLNGIMSYAIEEEIISHNPVSDVNFKQFTYKPVEAQSDNVFSRDDTHKLLNYLVVLDKIKYKETSTKYAILFVGNTTKGGIIMLKFQDNNTTVIATFEDFILTAYVIIDELYHQFAPPEVTRRRHILNAKLSDSEIITISLCGELAGVDSENAWFSFVKRNYRHLFPQLCSRSRFNRTRRALMQTTELLRQKMISVFPIPVSSYYIVDSFPLAVCKFGRARYCKAFRGHGADYGKCPSKKETYYGYKVHALITLEGYIASFEITPASTDDREGLRDLADHWSNVTILADKGYVGKNMKQEMQEKNICLFALKRSNSKENWPKSVRQLIFKLRRRVETVFSQLSGQLNAERVLAKSFQGLCTRLVNKVLAYNLCIALNSIFGETCELGKIKKLIF